MSLHRLSDLSRNDSHPLHFPTASCRRQLAKKKTYPSLYELFLMGLLPERTAIVGYARSPMADDDANKKIRAFLKSGTDSQRDAFLALCTYRCGGYDDPVAFGKVRVHAALI